MRSVGCSQIAFDGIQVPSLARRLPSRWRKAMQVTALSSCIPELRELFLCGNAIDLLTASVELPCLQHLQVQSSLRHLHCDDVRAEAALALMLISGCADPLRTAGCSLL
jgi:hypothetical protein